MTERIENFRSVIITIEVFSMFLVDMGGLYVEHIE